jgi:hypothetical protein
VGEERSWSRGIERATSNNLIIFILHPVKENTMKETPKLYGLNKKSIASFCRKLQEDRSLHTYGHGLRENIISNLAKYMR